jgi:phenylalanine-4-hydroxylase
MIAGVGPYLIEQNYQDYTTEQHQVWSDLVRHRRSQLNACACREYWEGYEAIGIRADRLPCLASISERLEPVTRWSTQPVSGFLPARIFFEMLTVRWFPTTTWLRDRDNLEYTPEPDIFHDVFGHVPMLVQPVFADFVEHYGSLCSRIRDEELLERLGRLFWYTVEFGLIREKGQVRVYGSGIISSHRECSNVMEGSCEIRPFRLNEVLDTPVKVDEVHKRLFAIESFGEVYEAMEEVERRIAQSGWV